MMGSILSELGTRGVLVWTRGRRWAFGNGGIDVEVFEVYGILVRLQHNQIQWRITG